MLSGTDIAAFLLTLILLGEARHDLCRVALKLMLGFYLFMLLGYGFYWLAHRAEAMPCPLPYC